MKRAHQPCSEAQRQLCELPLSQREIAAALGTSHQNVARWQTSPRAPAYEVKLKIAETLGIPAPAWDQAPVPAEHAETLAGSLAGKLRARLEAQDAAKAAAEPLPDDAAALDALIGQLRAARGADVSPALLVRLAAAETRAAEVRGRMRSAVELAFRHPETLAWWDKLLDVVAEHPLAELELLRREIEATAPERLAGWDADVAAWRERHWEIVDAAERANAEVRRVLPHGAPLSAVPRTSAPRVAA
jgi:transcriptional regulator with XRE-family HTH domain